MDIESEIRELKRRVDDLEGAVSVLTGQLGNVAPALVQIKDVSEHGLATIGDQMARFVKRLDTMNTQVWSLRDDLPGLVADAVKKSLGKTHN